MSPRIVIVGGVAGGMSAATRARRMNEHASIIVLEKGGFVSFANCGLPYYLAGRIESEDKLLVATPQKVRDRYNIDARVGQEVTRIERGAKQVVVRDHAGGREYRLGYDKLILAPGAGAIVPPIENARAPNVFSLRSMEDTQVVHHWLTGAKPKSAVIVGAGFIGLEAAEALRDRRLAVTLVEKKPQVLPQLDPEMATPVGQELERNGVRVILGSGLKSLRAPDGRVVAVETESGEMIEADGVLLSIGVRPNVALATSAGLKPGPTGAIAVDEFQRTSDADIYAVGDAAEGRHGVTGAPAWFPLAGPANRQGRLAGEHAATGSSAPAGKLLGTAIVQVFTLAASVTGLTEPAARAAGFDVAVAYVTSNHHAGYYPGARPLRIKLVYDNVSGRVLGAQIVGEAGVDKRLDAIATALHFGATIDDLAELDLAYAPQFASAKDPVHLAGMVAQNQRRQLTAAVRYDPATHRHLIDVRTPEEFARGTIDGAVNFPLDQLRRRLGELDAIHPAVIFCQGGQRGYVAQRILCQSGFNCCNLAGGISLIRDSR